jgi:hypothetical protein
MSTNQKTVRRDYIVSALICAAAYVGLVFGAKLAIRHFDPHGPLLMAMAVTPALPIIAYFFVFARYLARIDEYQRALIVRAMLVAVAAMISISAVWDFLQAYGGVAPPEPFIFTTGFIAIFGLAQGLTKLLEKFGGRS